MSSSLSDLDVPQPLGNVVEALRVGDIVHEHDSHGPPVVARGDGVEPFLSRGVPDLSIFIIFTISKHNSSVKYKS